MLCECCVPLCGRYVAAVWILSGWLHNLSSQESACLTRGVCNNWRPKKLHGLHTEWPTAVEPAAVPPAWLAGRSKRGNQFYFTASSRGTTVDPVGWDPGLYAVWCWSQFNLTTSLKWRQLHYNTLEYNILDKRTNRIYMFKHYWLTHFGYKLDENVTHAISVNKLCLRSKTIEFTKWKGLPPIQSEVIYLFVHLMSSRLLLCIRSINLL